MTDWFTTAVVAIALLCGGLVKGVVGLGLPLVALPILLLAVDVKTAVQTMAMPLVVSNFAQSLEGGDTLALTRRLAPVLAAVIVGVVLGHMIAARLDEHVILTIVGALVTIMAAISARPAAIVIRPDQERWVGPIVGVCAGVLGGFAALFGPPLAIYLVGLRLGREAFVKAVSILYLTASITILALATGGLYANPTLLLWAAIALVPMFAGMRVGRAIRLRINPEKFRLVVLAVVGLSGLNMLRSGLGW
jgi:uncharacterized protein